MHAHTAPESLWTIEQVINSYKCGMCAMGWHIPLRNALDHCVFQQVQRPPSLVIDSLQLRTWLWIALLDFEVTIVLNFQGRTQSDTIFGSLELRDAWWGEILLSESQCSNSRQKSFHFSIQRFRVIPAPEVPCIPSMNKNNKILHVSTSVHGCNWPGTQLECSELDNGDCVSRRRIVTLDSASSLALSAS